MRSEMPPRLPQKNSRMSKRDCLAWENIFYFHFQLQKCHHVLTLFHDFKSLYKKQWRQLFNYFLFLLFPMQNLNQTALRIRFNTWIHQIQNTHMYAKTEKSQQKQHKLRISTFHSTSNNCEYQLVSTLQIKSNSTPICISSYTEKTPLQFIHGSVHLIKSPNP